MIGILIQEGECGGTSLTITGMKHGTEQQYLVASYFCLFVFVTNVHAHTFVTKTVQR